MKSLSLLLLSLIFASCATTMPGQQIDTNNKKVTATFSENKIFTNERIQFYQFSIKNNTDEWIEFNGFTINGAKEVEVLIGNRIDSWIEACTLEDSVSRHNTSLLLGAIAAGGAIVAGSTNHANTGTVGAAVALGSISALAVRDYQNSKHKIEFQKAFPRTHIFRNFSLPPKKVIQRWILIENPQALGFTLSGKADNGEQIKFEFVTESGPDSLPQ